MCILKVVINNKEHYFTAFGHHDSDPEIIYFPEILGQKLFIEENSVVTVSIVKDSVPDCLSCNFSLDQGQNTVDLQSIQDELRDQILNQLRVIYPNMVFPFLCKDDSILYFKIHSIIPKSKAALLVPNTEIHFTELNSPNPPDQDDTSLTNFSRMLKDPFGFLFSKRDQVDTVDSSSSSKFKSCNNIGHTIHSKIFTVIKPFDDLNYCKTQINTIWINPKYMLNQSKITIVILHKLLSKSEKIKRKENKSGSNSKTVDQSFVISDEIFLSTIVDVKVSSLIPQDCIIVSDNLRQLMDLHSNSKVFIQKPNLEVINSSELKIPSTTSLSLYPLDCNSTFSREFIKTSLKNYATENDHLVGGYGSLLKISGQLFYAVTDSTIIYIDNHNIDDVTIYLKSVKISPNFTTKWGKSLPLSKLTDCHEMIQSTSDERFGFSSINGNKFISWMENESTKLEAFLNLIFNHNHQSDLRYSLMSKTLLLCGASKSGKSSLLKHVIEKFEKNQQPPLYVRTIKCNEWKSMTKLKSSWNETFEDCVFYQPSILIVDGLDLVASKISREEEGFGTETMASLRVAHFFASLTRKLVTSECKFGFKIAIIATCKSEETLNLFLAPSSGECIFYDTINMPSPDYDQRETILTNLLLQKRCKMSANTISSSLIASTYGYSFSDLDKLIDLAIHHSLTSKSDLNELDLLQTRAQFKPSFMQGIKSHAKSSLTFSNIGGLDNVKKILSQTILQPLKYPILYSKCPIRPPQNVLLYGPPGTGKSMIADALANESNIQVIKVRGPELLSKYIGRSEESIRLLFENARKIKPCVIFFDEFDSLATRRGQDTTGVTDRVVNQLLVQMDGVETIDRQIFVVATTSRPDMIDPALLRPGRLDKWLRCDYPNADERLEIWKIFSSTLSTFFDDTFDHSMISGMTENFSGADIKALLINSLYEAIDEYESKDAHLKSSLTISITKEHLMKALQKTSLLYDNNKRKEYQQL